MNTATTLELTEKQRAVIERVDRRVPIKVIASDLGVSEARINQHIRTLKDKFGAESLNALVEAYRASPGYEDGSETPYRKPIYRKSQLPDEPIVPDQGSRVDPGEIVLSDAHHVLIDVPWSGTREPAVVPPKLDGDQAVLYRSAAMLSIAVAIIAIVILTVSAALTVSEVLDGKAEIQTDNQGS